LALDDEGIEKGFDDLLLTDVELTDAFELEVVVGPRGALANARPSERESVRQRRHASQSAPARDHRRTLKDDQPRGPRQQGVC